MICSYNHSMISFIKLIYFIYFFIKKMSRVQRNKQYNITIEQKWIQKFWSFIQENPDKDWDWAVISFTPLNI